ncbi:MAG TPA: NapC/NirT family cytochrome c [Thermoanaerobaculia bacterium]|nr:NapC/NirT family cytochrome c [Thermoanaerobaculia bacterium]
MISWRSGARLSRNVVSIAGVVIALVGLANFVFLLYINATRAQTNPYFGILTWIVAPAILTFGLALFLLGMLIERRRRRRLAPDQIPEYPQIDLNRRGTRLKVIIGSVGLLLFVTMSVVASYQAYHYTDSDAFCGTLCHQVMHPEYIAYKNSPHARVGCAGCHVGPGAGWFVRSKLSGAYQVYATLAKKYPKPIPTPVESLRPAQDTCEQCHWPEKFWGAQLKTFDHYGYDEESTLREVRLLIKTGGGDPDTGLVSGIHWHMNIGNEVTYVATDPKRQVIPWVQLKDRQGRVTVFKSEDSKLTDAQLAALPKRTMDCIDCHNRPSHIYVSPDRAVDQALRAGTLDRSLPYIKQQSVAVLAKDYGSTPEALRTIARELPAWYQENHPDVASSKRPQIDAAVKALQKIFSTTRFPEMKVDWRTHPDNIGHYTSIGCFRCHDDQHVSADGKRITKACEICHTIVRPDEGQLGAFEHPVDIGDLRGVTCNECHTGSGM